MDDIQVTTTIPFSRLTDMLTSALEGGSNYWYMIDKDRSSLVGREFIVDEPEHGGTLCITLKNEEDGPVNGRISWMLNRMSMIEGARIMADKYHKHWADFMQENDDACTADVYLQVCLFGEVIFG